MATYFQADRSLRIATPLGQDVLLATGFTGREAISELFRFEVDLIAENATEVPFQKILGEPVGFRLEQFDQAPRFFSGICSRVAQGHRDEFFTAFRMEVVPTLWFLTRIVGCRIFQQVGVPEILRSVFRDLHVEFDLKGTYEPRDFCVQYNESDFDFASRLMEEEGIFYFFRHEEKRDVLVLGDTPEAHPEVSGPPSLIYDVVRGGNRDEARITLWEKVQELRSGKVTLRDHCFELPHKHLEAQARIQEFARVGEVSHNLEVGQNGKLELYEYPGAYAQRFDGVTPGGGDRPADLQKIFEDNGRTAGIRMQEEAAHSVTIRGEGNCGQLVAGHRFALERHFDADGGYVLTSVTHRARVDYDYRSGDSTESSYENSFTSIPVAVPYRPERRTPKPVVHGTQTAIVTGPAGEEIFTDKHGRVKVQFHWDREGKNDVDSSCWVRVATPWAGSKWGMIHIPRIGQEVVVAFEHGDPDRPMVVGSVYNDRERPPFELPGSKTISGIKSQTHMGPGYNEMVFDDTAAGGKQLIRVHGQYDMDSTVEHDLRERVLNDRSRDVTNNETITIGVDQTETVKNNRTQTIGVDHTETIGSNRTLTVGSNQTASIGANKTETVGIISMENVGVAEMESIGVAKALNVGVVYAVNVGAVMNTIVGISSTEQVGVSKSVTVGNKLSISAGEQIEIKVGAASILMKQDGSIKIKGKDILIEGSGKIVGKAAGDMVLKASKIGQN